MFPLDFLSFVKWGNFLFGLLHTSSLLQKGSILEKKNWGKVFYSRIDPLSEGRQYKFDRVASLEFVSILL